MVLCNKCGHELVDESLLCSKCGERLISLKSNNDKEKLGPNNLENVINLNENVVYEMLAESKKKIGLIISLVGISALIGIIAGCAVDSNQNNGNKETQNKMVVQYGGNKNNLDKAIALLKDEKYRDAYLAVIDDIPSLTDADAINGATGSLRDEISVYEYASANEKIWHYDLSSMSVNDTKDILPVDGAFTQKDIDDLNFKIKDGVETGRSITKNTTLRQQPSNNSNSQSSDSKNVKQPKEIELGMTDTEVKGILGEPTEILNTPADSKGTIRFRWFYTGHGYVYFADHKVWQVTFKEYLKD